MPTTPVCLPAALLEITTPLISKVWEHELATHPDQSFASYVVNGIKQGFRVGYDHSRTRASSESNMASAIEHPDVVSDYLQQQVSLNRMVVIPPTQVPYIHCHISPFGVIPKKAKPGKWRLIVDLSSPMNASVNDGIDRDMCSILYITIDQVVDVIVQLGHGALMAKVDIKQAYRIVPVHPDDRHLLGVQWEGQVLLSHLVYGRPRSYSRLLQMPSNGSWKIKECTRYSITWTIFTLGPPLTPQCQRNLEGIIHSCQSTGTPLEEDKCVISFLGMELDSQKMEIRLPADKLERLRQLLTDWKGRKAGKKRELLSLIGYLQHASKAVRQGPSFLRRLIALSTAVRKLDNFVRLNVSARSDIQWWSLFAARWNGTSMLMCFDRANPQISVTSDASGIWGCGAYEGDKWLQFEWPTTMEASHISVREMIPVVMAAALWGQY